MNASGKLEERVSTREGKKKQNEKEEGGLEENGWRYGWWS